MSDGKVFQGARAAQQNQIQLTVCSVSIANNSTTRYCKTLTSNMYQNRSNSNAYPKKKELCHKVPAQTELLDRMAVNASTLQYREQTPVVQ